MDDSEINDRQVIFVDSDSSDSDGLELIEVVRGDNDDIEVVSEVMGTPKRVSSVVEEPTSNNNIMNTSRNTLKRKSSSCSSVLENSDFFEPINNSVMNQSQSTEESGDEDLMKPAFGHFSTDILEDYVDDEMLTHAKRRKTETVSPPIAELMCEECKIPIYESSAKCCKGHLYCKSCIEKRAKEIIKDASAGQLLCCIEECKEPYSRIELERVLPIILVEIMCERQEEPADTGYLQDLYQDQGDDDTASDTPDGLFDDAETGETQLKESPEESQKYHEDKMPPHWEAMDPDSNGYKMIELDENSSDYMHAMCQFHDTMFYPKSQIVSIKRVQNPRKWQYFCIKKKEMTSNNGGADVEEKFLFHGTTKSIIDSICANNFDWRRCGRHGTAYGKGSYFAVNANYSDRYTDKANPRFNQGVSLLCEQCGTQSPVYSQYIWQQLPRLAPDFYNYFNPPAMLTPMLTSVPPAGGLAFSATYQNRFLQMQSHLNVMKRQLKGAIQNPSICVTTTNTPGATPVGVSSSMQSPVVSTTSNLAALQSVSAGVQSLTIATTAPTSTVNQSTDVGSVFGINTASTSLGGATFSAYTAPPSGSLSSLSILPFCLPSAKSKLLVKKLAKVADRLPSSVRQDFIRTISQIQTSQILSPTDRMQKIRTYVEYMTRHHGLQVTGLPPLTNIQGSAAAGVSHAVGQWAVANQSLLAAQSTVHVSQPSTAAAGGASAAAANTTSWGNNIPAATDCECQRICVIANSVGESSENRSYMFLAKVLVGKYEQGYPHYTVPPPIDIAHPLGEAYDSCVDNVSKPSIYVIFYSEQCYPEYLIEYSSDNIA